MKKLREASPHHVGTHFVGVCSSSNGLRFNDLRLSSGVSKSAHYPPLIHSCGSTGSSCCAATVSPKHCQNLQPLTSNDISTSLNAWSHVYSQRKANCSRCTQCASVAHSTDTISSSVRCSRYRQAKKKQTNYICLLREVVVSLDQVPFSVSYIDEEFIVFDGGNFSCPPITPPKTIKWRCHHMSDLHIEDDLRGDIGLTFRHIDGCLFTPQYLTQQHWTLWSR